jgi:acetyl-CoA synthetase
MQPNVSSGLSTPADPAVRKPAKTWFILGCSDDTIKLAGKRVGPAEIEEVLQELPEVAEAAAIAMDDAAKGHKLAVFLVRAGGAGEDAAALAFAVQRHVDQRLGRPFRPGAVHVVSQLPRTRSSKVMRRVIRSVYCRQPSGDLSALDNPAAIEELKARLIQGRHR